jgi:hypothetical protein
MQAAGGPVPHPPPLGPIPVDLAAIGLTSLLVEALTRVSTFGAMSVDDPVFAATAPVTLMRTANHSPAQELYVQRVARAPWFCTRQRTPDCVCLNFGDVGLVARGPLDDMTESSGYAFREWLRLVFGQDLVDLPAGPLP